MIGKLKGTVAEIETNYILLDVNNVFYKVFLPMIVLRELQTGTEFSCYTHFHVRENEISLYGFPDQEYLQVFNLLLNVPNVGPKSALTIIGFDRLEKLVLAVKNQEEHYFSQIPGIGKKTSQKILLDLASKFAVDFNLKKTTVTADSQLVIEALLTLGFKRQEADRAIANIDSTLPLEERITLAIRNLNNHGE